MSLKSSDHKPVSCLLEIGVRTTAVFILHLILSALPHVCLSSEQIKMVNEESYKRKFEEIVRYIDRLENDCIPSVSVSQSEVMSIFIYPFFAFDTSRGPNPVSLSSLWL